MSNALYDEAVKYFQTLEAQLVSGRLPEPVVVKAAWYMFKMATEDFEKTLKLWAMCQTSSEVLFSIHPYIEGLVVKGALAKDNSEASGLVHDFSLADIRQLKFEHEEKWRQKRKKRGW